MATKKSTSQVKKNPLYLWGSYGWTEYNRLEWKSLVDKVSRKIKKLQKEIEFDAIAFTGSSGCAMGFIVGYKTGIPVIYVRKSGENSHGLPIESNCRTEIHRYLIVDDFICGGGTIRSIVEKINDYAKGGQAAKPIPAGILLYDEKDDGYLRDFLKVGRRKIDIHYT